MVRRSSAPNPDHVGPTHFDWTAFSEPSFPDVFANHGNYLLNTPITAAMRSTAETGRKSGRGPKTAGLDSAQHRRAARQVIKNQESRPDVFPDRTGVHGRCASKTEELHCARRSRRTGWAASI